MTRTARTAGTYTVLAQRYYGDVTIAPPGYTLDHFRHVLSEPNRERWHWFRLQGERATWPKIAMIRTHTRISETLTDNIQACLNGTKTPAQAMADAQTESDRVLRPFRRG